MSMRPSHSFAKSLIILVAAGALVALGYVYRSELSPLVEKVGTIFGTQKPCTQPIEYSLGNFDARSGVSRSQFLLDVAAAADIWSKAAKRPLFEYADTGGLKINLIYDYRQQATAEMHTIGTTIDTASAKYDALKSTYNSLMATFIASKATLETQFSDYSAAKAAYEKEAAYWNDRGGVPPAQFASLEQERMHVNAMATAVNQSQAAFNALVDKINTTASSLNQMAKQLNLNVANYNSVGASTGVEFDEGEYVRDAGGTRIDIYQFENNDKLVRVLAHELGHALGLDHVDDPKAIMYRLNQASTETPTAADIDELKTVCGIK